MLDRSYEKNLKNLAHWKYSVIINDMGIIKANKLQKIDYNSNVAIST